MFLAALGVVMSFGAGIWVGCGITIKAARRLQIAERAWRDALQDALASAMVSLPPAVNQEIVRRLEKAKEDG